MGLAQKKNKTPWPLLTGSYSKKEAALRIAEGVRSLFCLDEGSGANLVPYAQKALSKHRVPRFPWELLLFRRTLRIDSSVLRANCIEKIVKDLGLEKKRDLRERVTTILEELITNAIYHGNNRYPRNQQALLGKNEAIKVSYAKRETGIYLSVTDFGGRLNFNHVRESFTRCYYGQSGSQVESKEEGAGLGMYLVFEACMHLKIVVRPGNETRVSCWIPARAGTSDHMFSFNYYEED